MRFISWILIGMTLAGCASRPYPAELGSLVSLRERAVAQQMGPVRVSAAVPSADETTAIFHLPLYDRLIQPVWLEVHNGSPDMLRFAPVSLDREYFAPLEVAYIHRGGYSEDGRRNMNIAMFEGQMPRYIESGETASGFVFTHVEPGTKGFNVDLFGPELSDFRFTFFVDVDGFVPDHSQVDFEGLYPEFREMDRAGLRAALAQLPCCPERTDGKAPLPLNVVVVANGGDVLQALLRAGWYESPARPEDERAADAQLFGRGPDAVFRINRSGAGERNELRLWLTPQLVDGHSVWLGQITHYVAVQTLLGPALSKARLDPDVDDARNFMMQLMWYAQSVEAIAWSQSDFAVPLDHASHGIQSTRFFTDGNRLVLWLSGAPVSLSETVSLEWDDGPGGRIERLRRAKAD